MPKLVCWLGLDVWKLSWWLLQRSL